MLAKMGAMPGFKMFGGGRKRNPLVATPPQTAEALERATGVLITHEHPDHFDLAGRAWTKTSGLPVWANQMDVPRLRRKGLDARPLEDGGLGVELEVVPSRHGRGLLGWMLGPVAGYYLAAKGEPSLYITGDSILTDSVREAIGRLQPDVIVAPAGAANMGIGGDILFSVDELVELAGLAPADVVFNHLEALDHCPTTRVGLRERMQSAGLLDRVHIPEDGDVLHFDSSSKHRPETRAVHLQPGPQKWMTSALAGG
ncbi:MAG: MBL fold metallo-hydrolase [Nannocystaceae bacterium]|nr:MBL fold metallo-hydrolase [Nannocystaceae bacterium]